MWSCQHGDGADIAGDQETLVGPGRRPFGIAVVGGPTAVIDIAGTRIVTDPTFDPPTDYGYLRKLAGPAVGAQALGQVDIVLLSHDLHPDNFDHAGRGRRCQDQRRRQAYRHRCPGQARTRGR